MPEAVAQHANPVRVMAVASGKGGVGKTSISVNLAACLAKSGKAVMLMDADLGLANVDVQLGLHPEFDLSHVINGEKTLDEIILEGPLGIRIVPAASGLGHMADLSVAEHAGLIQAFSELQEPVDYLIIDTAAGISENVMTFSKASQDIIVVVCDEPASLTDAYALIKVLNQEHKVTNFRILCNRVSDNLQGKRLFMTLSRAAEKFINVSLNYLGSIPEDPRLKDAQKLQEPVICSHTHSAASISFQSLAEKVQALPAVSHNNGNLEFFIERVIESNNVAESSCL